MLSDDENRSMLLAGFSTSKYYLFANSVAAYFLGHPLYLLIVFIDLYVLHSHERSRTENSRAGQISLTEKKKKFITE